MRAPSTSSLAGAPPPGTGGPLWGQGAGAGLVDPGQHPALGGALARLLPPEAVLLALLPPATGALPGAPTACGPGSGGGVGPSAATDLVGVLFTPREAFGTSRTGGWPWPGARCAGVYAATQLPFSSHTPSCTWSLHARLRLRQ